MVEIKTIAIPVDFSEVSSIIAEWGKVFAKKLGAKIVLINVIEDISAFDMTTDAKTIQELEKNPFRGSKRIHAGLFK